MPWVVHNTRLGQSCIVSEENGDSSKCSLFFFMSVTAYSAAYALHKPKEIKTASANTIVRPVNNRMTLVMVVS